MYVLSLRRWSWLQSRRNCEAFIPHDMIKLLTSVKQHNTAVLVNFAVQRLPQHRLELLQFRSWRLHSEVWVIFLICNMAGLFADCNVCRVITFLRDQKRSSLCWCSLHQSTASLLSRNARFKRRPLEVPEQGHALCYSICRTLGGPDQVIIPDLSTCSVSSQSNRLPCRPYTVSTQVCVWLLDIMHTGFLWSTLLDTSPCMHTCFCCRHPEQWRHPGLREDNCFGAVTGGSPGQASWSKTWDAAESHLSVAASSL